MPSHDLTDRIDGLLHEETQVHEDGVDLSVAAVHQVVEPGRVDFGGGELEPARTVPVSTRKRNPDDDYEWWFLSPGQYLVEYNETLVDEGRLTVQTRHAVRERGAFHPTLHVRDLDRIPLSVGGAGIHVKENARLSRVLPVEE